MADRFASIDEEDTDRLLLNKDSSNTRKVTENAVKILRSYLKSKGMSEWFEQVGDKELDAILGKFYVEVRQVNGEQYKKASLISIRHGSRRYIETLDRDITTAEFKSSNKLFEAVCKELKRLGKGSSEHYPALDPADLQKLMSHFDLDNNIRLQQKLFVDISIYFGRRGRENFRDLKIDDFGATQDGEGDMFIYMTKDELTKNHQKDANSAEGRMYAKPDDDMCPLRSFMKYKRHLNKGCTFLFQRPRRKITDKTWYDNALLGHKSLGQMMPVMSAAAKLSKRYTNHSLRATTVKILDKAAFPSRHIMAVTGHKAETRLKTYSGTTDPETKKQMSHVLSSSMRKPAAAAQGRAPSDNIQNALAVHDELKDVETDNILAQIDTNNLTQSVTQNFTNNDMPVFPNITNYGSVTINYHFHQ